MTATTKTKGTTRAEPTYRNYTDLQELHGPTGTTRTYRNYTDLQRLATSKTTQCTVDVTKTISYNNCTNYLNETCTNCIGTTVTTYNHCTS